MAPVTHRMERPTTPWLSIVAGTVLSIFALVVKLSGQSEAVVFVASSATLIPLGTLMRHCVHHLVWWLRWSIPHFRHGDLLGGGLDCLFGGAPELVFSIVALARHETLIVQTSVVGAVLSNSLLVLGTCFIVGGGGEQDTESYPYALAVTHSQLLMIGMGGLMVPAAFATWSQLGQKSLVSASHGAAVILLLLYGYCWWFFFSTSATKPLPAAMWTTSGGPKAAADFVDKLVCQSREIIDARNAKLRPMFALGVAAGALSVLFNLYALNTVSAVTEQWHVSKSFLGLVVMPLVTSTVESVIAVLHVHRDEMDGTVQATLMSNVRIALFVLPVAICAGWAMDATSITLGFDGFHIALLFVTAMLLNLIFQGTGSR